MTPLEWVVHFAARYESARQHYAQYPEDPDALFQKEYELEMLENAIDAEFVERNTAT